MGRILITGANRGIGLEMTRQAVERGDTVITTVRDKSRAGDLEALASATGKVSIHEFDVMDEASIAALGEAVEGSIDLLVCNAGILNSYGGLDDAAHTMDAWRDVLMTNVAGPYLVVRALMGHLAADAKVAIISSIMGSNAFAAGSAYPYRASKAAATNVARNLALELGDKGIAVGAYHPGWVRTDMGGPRADISAQESAEGLLQRFDALSLETSGVFEDYRGRVIPF